MSSAVLVGPVYPYRGGIAHYTTMLARALAERHETRVISFKRQYPAWLYPGRSDKDPSREPLQTEAEFLLDPMNPLTWRATARRILALRPALLVLQWWTTFWAPATAAVAGACRRAGLPVVFLIHNVLPHEARPGDRLLAKWALRSGAGFVVHTEAEQERLLSLLPQAQVRVCPFPLYDFFDAPEVTRAEARQRLGLPPEAPVLLFFGIVRPYKGLACLLEAIALLRKRQPEVFLVVAGEFWENKAAYLAQIERAGLTGRVRLDDRYIPNEEVGLYFTAADLLVLPYTGGTQSAAATVALASSLPLVVTERIAEGLPASVRQNTHIAPPGDALALDEAIRAALNGHNGLWESRFATSDGWRQLVNVLESSGGLSHAAEGLADNG